MNLSSKRVNLKMNLECLLEYLSFFIITNECDLSFFISIKWDSSESDPIDSFYSFIRIINRCTAQAKSEQGNITGKPTPHKVSAISSMS